MTIARREDEARDDAEGCGCGGTVYGPGSEG